MISPREGESQGRWHFDRTVNLTVLFGFLTATASGIWFASAITLRVAELEHKAEMAAPQVERIIRLESKTDSIKETVTEIKNLLRVPQDQRR